MDKVSWLIPIYKPNFDWLRDTINSCYAQSGIDWCGVLIDDGNDGPTADSIEQLGDLDSRWKIVHLKHNSGVAEALNAGLKALPDCSHVARIDADDTSYPDRLQKQLHYLKSNDLDLIGCGIRFVQNDKHKDQLPVEDVCYFLKLGEMTISHPCWFFKVGIITQYETDYPWAEDFATLCRVYKEGKHLGNIPEILVTKRQHQDRASVVHRQLQGQSKNAAMRKFL
jgi:glycosyltransferase involved in cell wall biosynthesis